MNLLIILRGRQLMGIRSLTSPPGTPWWTARNFVNMQRGFGSCTVLKRFPGGTATLSVYPVQQPLFPHWMFCHVHWCPLRNLRLPAIKVPSILRWARAMFWHWSPMPNSRLLKLTPVYLDPRANKLSLSSSKRPRFAFSHFKRRAWGEWPRCALIISSTRAMRQLKAITVSL